VFLISLVCDQCHDLMMLALAHVAMRSVWLLVHSAYVGRRLNMIDRTPPSNGHTQSCSFLFSNRSMLGRVGDGFLIPSHVVGSRALAQSVRESATLDLSSSPVTQTARQLRGTGVSSRVSQVNSVDSLVAKAANVTHDGMPGKLSHAGTCQEYWWTD